MRPMLPPYRHDHAPDRTLAEGGVARWARRTRARRARIGGVIGGFVAAVLVNCATISMAQADDGRSVAILVEGPGGEAVADGIAAHIEQPNSVRPAQPMRAALAARGWRTLAPAAANRARSGQLVARAHAAAVQAGVDVAILVSMRKVHGTVRMHVWVIDAQGDGAWADKDVNPSSATPDGEADAVWDTTSGIFGAAKAAAPPAEARKTARKAGTAAPNEGWRTRPARGCFSGRSARSGRQARRRDRSRSIRRRLARVEPPRQSACRARASPPRVATRRSRSRGRN